jgi:hypothetical protein
LFFTLLDALRAWLRCQTHAGILAKKKKVGSITLGVVNHHLPSFCHQSRWLLSIITCLVFTIYHVRCCQSSLVLFLPSNTRFYSFVPYFTLQEKVGGELQPGVVIDACLDMVQTVNRYVVQL